jgi:hypothetical protein
MKIKTTAIIFALIMALQFIASAQTSAGETKELTKKPTTQNVQATERSEMPPMKVDAAKSAETPATAGCCKGKSESGCTGHKDGSKDCCKGSAKSGEGCKGHGDTKSSGNQGQSRTTGDAGQTKATGDANHTKSSKGCCHR